MSSGDNQVGESIFPGGVDLNVPDLTVARAVGTVVNLTATSAPQGLYKSLSASVASYQFIGGGNATPWAGQPEMVTLIVDSAPADDETYTLQVGSDSQVYTFKTVLTSPDVAGEVLIGSAAATQNNLATEINAVQGTVCNALNYANPLTITARDTADTITQTDGTGGNLTPLRKPQTKVEATQIVQFHLRRAVVAADVTDGYMLFALPTGYTPISPDLTSPSYSALVFDGSGGKGDGSMDVKAFDGGLEEALFTSGVPIILSVFQGSGSLYATGDVIVVWGYALVD